VRAPARGRRAGAVLGFRAGLNLLRSEATGQRREYFLGELFVQIADLVGFRHERLLCCLRILSIEFDGLVERLYLS
jgi:hypothetical protein